MLPPTLVPAAWCLVTLAVVKQLLFHCELFSPSTTYIECIIFTSGHIRKYNFKYKYLFLWSETFVDLGTNTDYYIYTSYMNDTTKWQNRLTSWICFQDTLQNVFNETERVDFWKFGHLAKFEIVPVKWQLKFAESNLKIKEAESPLMVKLSNVNTLRKF